MLSLRSLLTCGNRVGTELVIRLKWGQTEYKGTLESIDSYMNVLLRDTEEYLDGKHTGSLGLVLIRYVPLFNLQCRSMTDPRQV